MASVARESTNLTDLRVAIAEDDHGQRRLLQQLVEGLGCRVVSACTNGRQAIEECCDRDVQVALMDLDMPEVDGLEAAEQIAEWGIPVILITGMPDSVNLVVEREPIVAYLRKPLSLQALAAAIGQAMLAEER